MTKAAFPHDMEGSQAAPTRNLRRFLRFDTRALLAFVTLCCILAAFVKVRFVDQMLAHDRIINLRGGVGYTDSRLADVKLVHLGQTDIGDSELRVLKELPYLNELWLNDTKITDQGLKQLASIAPRLTFLDLRGTRVSEPSVDALQQDLPQCKIIADWSPAHARQTTWRGYNCPRCECNFYGYGGDKPCPNCNQVCTAPLQ